VFGIGFKKKKKVGGLFLSCISPVHMGSCPVRGRYQAMQGVSQHSTRMDSTDKSCEGTGIRTLDIAALDLKSGTLPMRHRLTQHHHIHHIIIYTHNSSHMTHTHSSYDILYDTSTHSSFTYETDNIVG
jgi:hypothetical protein